MSGSLLRPKRKSEQLEEKEKEKEREKETRKEKDKEKEKENNASKRVKQLKQTQLPFSSLLPSASSGGGGSLLVKARTAKTDARQKQVKEKVQEIDTTSRYVLPPLSAEQKCIVDSIWNGDNVVVNAVAGSGKSTTVLHIARTIYPMTLLWLTYNSSLKEEGREKTTKLHRQQRMIAQIKEADENSLIDVEESELNDEITETRLHVTFSDSTKMNVYVHTFHSFAVNTCDDGCFVDLALKEHMKNDVKLDKHKQAIHTKDEQDTYCDVVVFDEMQDMKPLLYQFSQYILSHIKPTTANRWNNCVKLCGLGDNRQCLYQHEGADPRYLTNMPELFDIYEDMTWVTHKLSTSYRVSPQTANFINRALLKQDNFIVSSREAKPNEMGKIGDGRPIYRVENFYPRDGVMSTCITDIICQLHEEHGVRFDEIMVLACTIKKSHIGHDVLARTIRYLKTRFGNNCLISAEKSEQSAPNTETMKEWKNKLVFSTFHAAKGTERNYIIIVGLEHNQFDWKKDVQYERCECPNVIYVGVSRPIIQLYLLQSHNSRPCKFIAGFESDNKQNWDTTILEQTTQISQKHLMAIMNFQPKENNDLSPAKSQLVWVTELVGRLSCNKLEQILPGFKPKVVVESQQNLRFTNVIELKNDDGIIYKESVSAIIGIAVTVAVELLVKKTCQCFHSLADNKQLEQHEKNMNKKGLFKRNCQSIMQFVNDMSIDHFLFNDEFVEMLMYNSLCFHCGETSAFELANKDSVFNANEIQSVHLLYQISRHNFCDVDNFNAAVQNAISVIKFAPDFIDDENEDTDATATIDRKKNNFEVSLPTFSGPGNKVVIGRIDSLNSLNSTYIEFKCVADIQSTHLIQIAAYRALVLLNIQNTIDNYIDNDSIEAQEIVRKNVLKKRQCRFLIANVRTYEVIEICAAAGCSEEEDVQNMRRFLGCLLSNSDEEQHKQSNEQFFAIHEEYKRMFRVKDHVDATTIV